MTSVDNTTAVLPPAWFSAALASAGTPHITLADGASIAYQAWGEPERSGRGIVLVHGGAAHSHWWDHIAPLLVEGRRRVVAIDLSGHGDSDRRDSYSLDGWAGDVLAVAAAAGITAPVVIGHSLGGLVTLRAAEMFGSRLAGVVVIDSPVGDFSPEEEAARRRRAFGALRVYSSPGELIARFRLIPDQPVIGYIADHVAATSVRRVAGGWTWKFDSRIFDGERPAALLTRLGCPVALLRAEHGIMSAAMSETMHDRLGPATRVIEIPAAGHHVMLDQPIALVAAVRALLSDWDLSGLTGRARPGAVSP